MVIAHGLWLGKQISSVATYQWLDDGKRLHLNHGPIDLIVEACGDSKSVATAYRQAHEAFQTILCDLVDELPLLRKPLRKDSMSPVGGVARIMYSAALPYCHRDFVTPMVAVAGSVADYVLQAMLRGCSLSRAYVNNGGDIALWLAGDERFTVGICENTETGHVGSRINLRAADGIQGIATSGWRGRSCSLGIADAVTVLASSAAMADVAATLIANAVDVPGCTGIRRAPAIELYPDSDLGDRLVTVGVEHLDQQDVVTAVESGRVKAQQLMCTGLIKTAYISLQGIHRICSQQNICAGVMHA